MTAADIETELMELLTCPVSGQALKASGESLQSSDAVTQYPLVNGIPWLLPNPLNSLVDWSVKLNHFNQILSDEIRQLGNDIKRAPEFTLPRLQKLLQSKGHFQQQVTALVSPILKTKVANKPVYDALSDRAPSTQNLLSYEANLYRDWVWGDEENQLSLDILSSHLKHISANKMLVLGAGSCRLAYDLHARSSNCMTVANDINPLLVLAAQQILAGEGLTIEEFPLHPVNTDSVAIQHRIPAVKEPPEGFHLLFSDALKPALKASSFDCVVTPWLIDIQPFELSRFLTALNHYLPIGGHWLNFGSLVFQQKRDSLCYSIDEIRDVASKAGFEIESVDSHEIPYLKSPFNAGYRMENVWSWKAKKVASVELAGDLQNLPGWLIDTSKPVPVTQEIQAFTFNHRLYAELAGEINGKRSIEQIASRIVKKQSMDPQEALSMVKTFYLKILQ